MNAEITVRFTASNLCEPEDLEQPVETFDKMVRYLIESEGLVGIIDDEGTILEIKEIA